MPLSCRTIRKSQKAAYTQHSRKNVSGQESVSSEFCTLEGFDAVCLFIAKDIHPYQTVNDLGFQRMLHAFDQRYHPPDRKAVSTKLIPKLYNNERKCASHALTSGGSFALTTDIRTSRLTQDTSLTVHCVNDSYNLQSHLLEAVEFPESHTGVNISEELINILEDWELLQDNLSAVTTDNGTSIVLAMELLQWSRVPHTAADS